MQVTIACPHCKNDVCLAIADHAAGGSWITFGRVATLLLLAATTFGGAFGGVYYFEYRKAMAFKAVMEQVERDEQQRRDERMKDLMEGLKRR